MSSLTTYYVSPLVRLGIFGLYITLLAPLPVLSQVTHAGVPSYVLLAGIGLGALILAASLSERLELDAEGIALVYPGWVPHWYRRGWVVHWHELQELKARSTGQGGLVYYLVTTSGQAYLLPTRIAGFAQMTRQLAAQTGLDTTLIRPLAQPWMYAAMTSVAVLMGLFDIWVLTTAWFGNFPTQVV
jgi:hypothetical protein